MSHNHEHHHHHEIKDLSKINNAFYIGIFLNLAFTIVEFFMGIYNNSLALISDATHNLSDVASLIISLIGLKLTQKATTKLYTYGYKKASILASLINAVLLIFVVFNILKEAFERFNSSPIVTGKIIIYTALIGVIINTISAFLFFKDQKDDINVRGAFVHLMVDAVISVGVVISGIVIHYTNLYFIDTIISLIIAVVILYSTWGLLKESLSLTLNGVPKDIDITKIKDKMMKNNQSIFNIHHIHIWALSTNINAITAHIKLKKDYNYSSNDISKLKNDLKHQLEHENIHHSTLEFETYDYECADLKCM